MHGSRWRGLETEQARARDTADLNPVPQGWAAYFAGKFSTIDSHVHERLAIFDNRKRNIPGRRWGKRHNGDWFRRLGVFRLSGNVHRQTAHANP